MDLAADDDADEAHGVTEEELVANAGRWVCNFTKHCKTYIEALPCRDDEMLGEAGHSLGNALALKILELEAAPHDMNYWVDQFKTFWKSLMSLPKGEILGVLHAI